MTLHRFPSAWTIAMWAWVLLAFAADAGAQAAPSHRMWRKAAQEQAMLDQRGVVLNDSALSDYLQSISTRLWGQVDTDLPTPVFQIIIDTRMEAGAYPNGFCFLTTGMLDRIENESQLAMIIAHEMVHYERQHPVALYDHFHKPDGTTVLPHADREPVTVAQEMQRIMDAAERQADGEGLAILMRAGYCEAEVSTLMVNLMNFTHDLMAPGFQTNLDNRTNSMNERLRQLHGRSSCPRSPDRDPEYFLQRIAPALMANAQTAMQHGRWNQAERSISRYMDVSPEDARAHYIAGELLRHDDHGQDLRCRASYEKALTIDPKFPLPYRALGELDFKAGRYGEAKNRFETFLNLSPQDEASEFIKGYLRQCQE